MQKRPGWTPGEWTAQEIDALNAIDIVDSDLCDIASVLNDDGELTYTDRANARLIAAAPDLYEALESARHTISVHERTVGPLPNVLAKIDAALSKARGGEA